MRGLNDYSPRTTSARYGVGVGVVGVGVGDRGVGVGVVGGSVVGVGVGVGDRGVVGGGGGGHLISIPSLMHVRQYKSPWTQFERTESRQGIDEAMALTSQHYPQG